MGRRISRPRSLIRLNPTGRDIIISLIAVFDIARPKMF